MAKRTDSDQQQPQAEETQVEAAQALPPRHEGETLMEYAKRLTAEKALLPSKTVRTRATKEDGSPSLLPRQLKREMALDAWASFTDHYLTVEELAESFQEAGLWNEKEASTIYLLSSKQGDPTTQATIAKLLGCNTWMVYNYRRDALMKLAELTEGSWEDLHETFGIRRGAARQERHTQYWPQVSQEELTRRKAQKLLESEARKREKLANKATGSQSTGDQ